MVDDLYDLDWMTKLAGQIIAAGVLAWQGVQLVSLPIGGSLAIGSPYMSLILTILAIVLVMNAVNFIDGLDGLVAGVTIIANSVFFIYSFVISITHRPDRVLQPGRVPHGRPDRGLPRLPAAQLASRTALHGRRGRPAHRPRDGDERRSP